MQQTTRTKLKNWEHVLTKNIEQLDEVEFLFSPVKLSYVDLVKIIEVINNGEYSSDQISFELCWIQLEPNVDYSDILKNDVINKVYPDHFDFDIEKKYLSFEDVKQFDQTMFVDVFESVSKYNFNRLSELYQTLYDNRKLLSDELKEKLTKIYYRTDRVSLKVVLGLILNIFDKIDISQFKIDEYDEVFVNLYGSFEDVKKIIKSDQLGKYYSLFCDYELIENAEMLDIVITDRNPAEMYDMDIHIGMYLTILLDHKEDCDNKLFDIITSDDYIAIKLFNFVFDNRNLPTEVGDRKQEILKMILDEIYTKRK